MNRLPSSLGIVVFLVVAVPAWAQSPHASNKNANDGTSIATIKVLSETASVASKPASTTQTNLTPHQQHQSQMHSPAEIAVRRAAAKADQRRQRLTAMKWQGYSNSRPQTRVDVTSW